MPRVASKPKGVRSWPDRVPADNRTLGWYCLAWTADWLLQPDGPNAGEPWMYTDEQARIILRWYQIDAHGKFAYRRGVLRRMKGWGKDPFLASVAAFELCGPCQFGGFDVGGAPRAQQHPAPWIQVAAVSREQTKNTMTLFPGMFSPEALVEYHIDPGKEVYYARQGRARIEAVTSSPRSLEGGRATLVVANETHHWIEANEGTEMSEVIKRNAAKSGSRSMEITNAHLPGEGSVAETTHDAWAESGGKLAGVYYDSLEAPLITRKTPTGANEVIPIDELTDDVVRSELLSARGDSAWLDVDRLLEEIRDPTSEESQSRRFYFNQVTKVGAVWLPPGAWDDREDKKRTIPDQTEVVLGFDGSLGNDVTCLVVVALETPDHPPHVDVVEGGVWLKPANDPLWTPPRQEVKDKVRAACKRWKVREIAWDEYLWRDSFEELEDEGLPVVAFPQQGMQILAATQRFYQAVTGKTMTHSGHPLLKAHIANARVKTDSRGSRLTKDAKTSTRKIDLAVASVMAFERAGNLAHTHEAPGIGIASYRDYEARLTPEAIKAKRDAFEAKVAAIRARAQGTTAQRGYGAAHQRLRREWAPKVERGEVDCARCGGPIAPGSDWHLGHTDDRSGYSGPEHALCNDSAAGKKGRS